VQNKGKRARIYLNPLVRKFPLEEALCQMPDTCALDAADRAPMPPRNGQYNMTLHEVGRRLGVTRERVRQIEAAALDRVALIAFRNIEVFDESFPAEG
jgi:hypothetical protein